MTDAPLLALALRLVNQEERLRPDAGWHPSPEELTAYRDGRLSPRRAGRVCRHLGVCCDCPDLLLALERFLEPLPDLPEDAGGDDSSWHELRRQLFGTPPARRPAFRVPPMLLSLRTAYAFAAASLVAAAALSFWSLLPRPLANVEIASIEMPGIRRGVEPQQEIPVSERGVLLVLQSNRMEDGAGLRLEILELSGRRVGTVDGLRSESGEIRAFIPRSLLPAGELRLRLTGRGLLEEVTIRVLHL